MTCPFCQRGEHQCPSVSGSVLDVSGPPVALNELCAGPSCRHPSHAVGAPDEMDALRAELDKWRARHASAEREISVWRKEHGQAHGNWLETRKKCSEAERQRDECAALAARRGKQLEMSMEHANTVLLPRIQALESALREIAAGKMQEDVAHPLGEWFSMAGRFITIACRTLKEQT